MTREEAWGEFLQKHEGESVKTACDGSKLPGNRGGRMAELKDTYVVHCAETICSMGM